MPGSEYLTSIDPATDTIYAGNLSQLTGTVYVTQPVQAGSMSILRPQSGR